MLFLENVGVGIITVVGGTLTLTVPSTNVSTGVGLVGDSCDDKDDGSMSVVTSTWTSQTRLPKVFLNRSKCGNIFVSFP